MIKTIFFAIFLVIIVSGCATVPVQPIAIPQETLQGFCRKYNVDCRWDGVSQAVNMVFGGKKIQTMVGSNIVLVDGQRIALSASLRRQRGAVVIPPDFERVVVGPAARPQTDYVKGAYASRIRRIVVDAGHGGKDVGAIGCGGLQEEDVVLDVARRVQKNFRNGGIEVVMTRDKNEFITLPDRTVVASRPGTDLFISIHANAHRDRHARGVEVYYPQAATCEDKDEEQKRKNIADLEQRLNMHHDSAPLNGIVADMLDTYKMSLSSGLAEAVYLGVVHDLGAESRGSKPQRYFVLRNTPVPAILIEVGFVTNPREAALLNKGEYRQKIADAITKNVLRFVYDSRM